PACPGSCWEDGLGAASPPDPAPSRRELPHPEGEMRPPLQQGPSCTQQHPLLHPSLPCSPARGSLLGREETGAPGSQGHQAIQEPDMNPYFQSPVGSDPRWCR
ncbi:unnamed protein product, partial [Rangifer tarandus platyrhynchus]